MRYQNNHYPFERLHIKIGIDTGATLNRFCRHFPDDFFIGIEWEPTKAKKAVQRLRRNGIRNATVVNSEAADYLKTCGIKNAVDCVHIYFPTPSLRKLRQKGLNVKTKLLTLSFLRLVHSVLRLGGSLRILTDDLEYLNEIENVVEFDEWWPVDWEPIECGQRPGDYVSTPCEVEFRNFEREIYPIQLTKI